MPSERDDLEEYWLVRRAVRDGIWDVIGTVMTVFLAFFLFLFGLAVISNFLRSGFQPSDALPVAFGLVLIAGAAVWVLREFRVFPFD